MGLDLNIDNRRLLIFSLIALLGFSMFTEDVVVPEAETTIKGKVSIDCSIEPCTRYVVLPKEPNLIIWWPFIAAEKLMGKTFYGQECPCPAADVHDVLPLFFVVSYWIAITLAADKVVKVAEKKFRIKIPI